MYQNTPITQMKWQEETAARITEAVRAIVRSTGRPASTVAISCRVGFSERQTRRWLQRLEGQQIRRVKQRSGWLLQ